MLHRPVGNHEKWLVEVCHFALVLLFEVLSKGDLFLVEGKLVRVRVLLKIDPTHNVSSL